MFYASSFISLLRKYFFEIYYNLLANLFNAQMKLTEQRTADLSDKNWVLLSEPDYPLITN